MKKFIVFYQAPASAMAKMAESTPEQKEEGMKVWYAWRDSLGDKLIDFGTPLMQGRRLEPNGSIKDSRSEVTGYSIFNAASKEEAESLLSSHPHLNWTDGVALEVHECIPL